MEPFTPERLLIIAAFVAVLVVMLILVRVNRGTLSSRIKAGRRIEIESAARVGPDAQATLLRIDGARVLVVSGKRTGIAIHSLSAGEDTA
ncbi:MAG: hypothetical protein MK180_18565 [Rhodobacteraceae bacterium]|nr:hypothetical protein [Paracoccaceae bacterium]